LSWNLSTNFTDFVIVGHVFSLFSDFMDFVGRRLKSVKSVDNHDTTKSVDKNISEFIFSTLPVCPI
jgi:hypothetical protein